MTNKWLMKQQLREQQEQQQNEELTSSEAEKILEDASVPSDPDRVYVWVTGDNIWQVTQRLHFTVEELLEHNDIEDHNNIAPGFKLHLPKPRPVELRKPIRYEMYPEPRVMHVIHGGGAHKVMFADVREWKDIKPTGALFPQNRNVTVTGLAHVPIGEDTAAFYMDDLAFGDYIQSGRVRYTIGFNHAHLAEGRVPQYVNPTPVVTKKIKKATSKIEAQIAEDAMKEGVSANKLVQEDPIMPQITPSLYKTTFEPFNAISEPVNFATTEDIIVEEHDTRRPSRPLPAGTEVALIGTFVKDGITYGRPANTQYWFGIPMVKVLPADEDDDITDEMYNTDVDLPTRVAMGNHGRLTTWEKWVTVPSLKVAGLYIKARDWIQNKNKKEQ